MPATVKKQSGKFRVVEPSGKLVRNRAGTPVDGGGHASKAKAVRQARAINMRR
jgi:hypothetical protein